MSGSKFRTRNFLLVFVIALLAGAAFFVVNKIQDDSQESQNAANASTTTAQSVAKTAKIQTTGDKTYVTTAEFKYLIPKGWLTVASSQLENTGAVSGIATEGLPITQFRIAVEPAESSPSTLDEFKKVTLETIQRYQNFQILESGPIMVSGKDGYSYAYKLGSDNMAQQYWIIFLHKSKAFSLLFTGPASNFKSQATTINNIVSSFQLL